MVDFHCYVSLPEGTQNRNHHFFNWSPTVGLQWTLGSFTRFLACQDSKTVKESVIFNNNSSTCTENPKTRKKMPCSQIAKKQTGRYPSTLLDVCYLHPKSSEESWAINHCFGQLPTSGGFHPTAVRCQVELKRFQTNDGRIQPQATIPRGKGPKKVNKKHHSWKQPLHPGRWTAGT